VIPLDRVLAQRAVRGRDISGGNSDFPAELMVSYLDLMIASDVRLATTSRPGTRPHGLPSHCSLSVCLCRPSMRFEKSVPSLPNQNAWS
jgi:hypothetical protein